MRPRNIERGLSENGKEGQDVTSAMCAVTDPAESPSPSGCVSERRKSSEDVPSTPLLPDALEVGFFPSLFFHVSILLTTFWQQAGTFRMKWRALQRPLFLCSSCFFLSSSTWRKSLKGVRGRGGREGHSPRQQDRGKAESSKGECLRGLRILIMIHDDTSPCHLQPT